MNVGDRVNVLQPAPYWNHWGTVISHSPASNPRHPWQVSFGPGLAYWHAESELEIMDSVAVGR